MTPLAMVTLLLDHQAEIIRLWQEIADLERRLGRLEGRGGHR